MSSPLETHARPLSIDEDLLVRLHATLAHRGRNALAVAAARLDLLEPLLGSDGLVDLRRPLEQFTALLDEIGRTCRAAPVRRRSRDLGAWLAVWCREVDVPLHSKGSEARCSFDEEVLHEILAELVSNARRHGTTPSVVLHASPLRIEIVDQGPGVPPEHLRWLGEAFFTTRASALGLGLHRARRLADAHELTLSFASAEGERGLRATLALSPVQGANP